ncbi:hypothetical protein ABZP36_028545 [Zizania latifolia]
MAAARQLPLQLPRPAEQMPRRGGALCGLFLLIGASVVVWSVAGKPPAAHAGYALAGFSLWLLGIALLLSPRAPHPWFLGVIANPAVEKPKYFFFSSQPPSPAPAPI